MKKVSNRMYIFQKILDYLGVAFLGILLLFLWQLYRGPIELPFLKPYVIQALNQDELEATVEVKSVSMELVRSLQPIKIVAKDISYKRNDNSIDIKAPRTTVSFSLKALLHGVVAPSSISVENPMVYIFSNYGVKETEKNEIGKKKLNYYTKALENFLERFTTDDYSYIEGYINNINITGGELEFHEVDLGKKWSFSDLNYNFSRNFYDISTDVNALVNLNDSIATVGVEAKYKTLQKKLSFDIYFTDLVLHDMMDAVIGKHPLQDVFHIDLPVSGHINTLINIDNVLKNSNNITNLVDSSFEKMNIQLEGGQGSVVFKKDIQNPYKIKSFSLDGNITGGMDNISIKNATFDLGDQNALLSFDISGFKNYFMEQSIKDLKMELTSYIDQMDVNKLSEYWPKFIATPGWEWCYSSLKDGTFHNAKFIFEFGTDSKTGEFGFLDLNGSGEVKGVSINYLTGMPKITNAVGTAEFTNHNIKITATSGESDGVKLLGGYVDLYDLDKEDNFADISLEMESSVAEALRVIDNDPLNYTSEMGLVPDKLGGTAKTKLGLKFEMKQNLTPAEVNVDVFSEINDFKMDNVIQDKSLTADKLILKVNNQRLLVEGDAFIDDIPITLEWNEMFSPKDYRSRYNIGFRFDDELKKKLGLNISLLDTPYVVGYVNLDIIITIVKDNKMDISLLGDLKPMDIDFSFLGFRKPINEEGKIIANIDIQDNKINKISNLMLENKDMSLIGDIFLDANNRVTLVNMHNINGDKTNAQAKIELSYDPKIKAKINISGQSYNLSPLFEKINSKTSDNKKTQSENNDDTLENTIDADIYIAVNNLWTNQDLAVTNFAGRAELVNGIGIKEIHAVGNYNTDKTKMLKFDYSPRPNDEFYLEVDSNDAGATMKVLGIYADMKDGQLKIEARRNKDKGLVGHAKIRDFYIQNTPLVAKFLSVASFRGMLDMLTGDGIAFSHLDAPFEYNNKQLMLKKAKAFGNVVGVTANGTYDGKFKELDIRGQVAPAYSLNMILGSIPLVGSLLAGKDGTVFAADYYISGGIEEASIKINPLSALSPNSLKETISSLFGGDNE